TIATTTTTATSVAASVATAIVATTTVAAIIPARGTRSALDLETITTIDWTIFTRHKWDSGSTAAGSADGLILLAARGMEAGRLRATTSCSTVWAPTGCIG